MLSVLSPAQVRQIGHGLTTRCRVTPLAMAIIYAQWGAATSLLEGDTEGQCYSKPTESVFIRSDGLVVASDDAEKSSDEHLLQVDNHDVALATCLWANYHSRWRYDGIAAKIYELVSGLVDHVQNEISTPYTNVVYALPVSIDEALHAANSLNWGDLPPLTALDLQCMCALLKASRRKAIDIPKRLGRLFSTEDARTKFLIRSKQSLVDYLTGAREICKRVVSRMGASSATADVWRDIVIRMESGPNKADILAKFDGHIPWYRAMTSFGFLILVLLLMLTETVSLYDLPRRRCVPSDSPSSDSYRVCSRIGVHA